MDSALTDLSETATRNDKAVVQGDESALAGNTVAKSRGIGVPSELRPITVDNKGPGLDERVLDSTLESWIGIETRKSRSFQFKALAGKVRINELFDLAIGRIGVGDGGKV